MSKYTNELRAIQLGDRSEGTLIMMLTEAADTIDTLQSEAANKNARSWEGQVDRQGGGFDQDEIDNRWAAN
jgi:hypothetical protein